MPTNRTVSRIRRDLKEPRSMIEPIQAQIWHHTLSPKTGCILEDQFVTELLTCIHCFRVLSPTIVSISFSFARQSILIAIALQSLIISTSLFITWCDTLCSIAFIVSWAGPRSYTLPATASPVFPTLKARYPRVLNKIRWCGIPA